MNLSESIKSKAIVLGFDLVGITSADPISAEHVEYLRRWLDTGCAAGMEYMHRNFDKRIAPRALTEGAKSVICVALSCKPSSDDLQRCGPPSDVPGAKIAAFALFDDYHTFIRNRLRKLAHHISTLSGIDRPSFKICVDSVPIAERSLAHRAGLGFIGRNHMLTSPRLGSQILLGLLITNIHLTPDRTINTPCADCTICIDACPTGAISRDGTFDSRKCISYLTLEHKGPVDPRLTGGIEDRLFGCDQCSSACPYTQNAPVRANDEMVLYPERQNIPLAELSRWEDEDFKRCFGDSAIERAGYERLKRNSQICVKNAASDHGAKNTSIGLHGTSRPS